MTLDSLPVYANTYDGSLLGTMNQLSDVTSSDSDIFKNINWINNNSYRIKFQSIISFLNCRNISIENLGGSLGISINNSSLKYVELGNTDSCDCRINNSSITSIFSLTNSSGNYQTTAYTELKNCTVSNMEIENSVPVSNELHLENCKITDFSYTNSGNPYSLLYVDNCKFSNEFILTDTGGTDFSFIRNCVIGNDEYAPNNNYYINRGYNTNIYNNTFNGNVLFGLASYATVLFTNNIINGNFASTSSSVAPSIPNGVIAPYNISKNMVDYFIEPNASN